MKRLVFAVSVAFILSSCFMFFPEEADDFLQSVKGGAEQIGEGFVGSITLYVDLYDGDDLALGTESQPFKTVQKAVDFYKQSGASEGTVLVRGGEGSVEQGISITECQDLEISGGWSVSNGVWTNVGGTKTELIGLIYVDGCSNLTLRDFVFNGPSGTYSVRRVEVRSSDSVGFERCEVLGFSYGGFYVNGSKVVWSDGVIADNKNYAGAGAYVEGNSDVLFLRTTISSNDSSGAGGDTFFITSSKVKLVACKVVDSIGNNYAVISNSSFLIFSSVIRGSAGKSVVSDSSVDVINSVMSVSVFVAQDTNVGFRFYNDVLDQVSVVSNPSSGDLVKLDVKNSYHYHSDGYPPFLYQNVSEYNLDSLPSPYTAVSWGIYSSKGSELYLDDDYAITDSSSPLINDSCDALSVLEGYGVTGGLLVDINGLTRPPSTSDWDIGAYEKW